MKPHAHFCLGRFDRIGASAVRLESVCWDIKRGEEPMADDAALLDALRDVVDPELMINIVDLGLVYDIEQVDNKVTVNMTLTSPACPAGPQIIQQAKMALEKLSDVSEAEIKLVMSPPWSPDRMTDEARDQLGIF
jgi:metal-sulfur cluster biosynthetic enzyme